jgi:hypothetical protein
MFAELRYWFERDWNKALYWKMRMYIQKERGGGTAGISSYACEKN